MSAALAVLNGQPVSLVQCNELDPGLPVVATVELTVRLAFADLVAALYLGVVFDSAEEDLDTWRELVVDAVANLGLAQLEETKAQIEQVRAGTDAAAWLAYCQRLALELLGLPTAATPAPATMLGGAW